MSITGQVGHITFAKQVAQGVPNLISGASAGHTAVKITGDSLVANNNPLLAEGEIGMGRDVTDAIPGGFQSAGAVNGNLRARAASILLEATLGTKVLGGGAGVADSFSPSDNLPWYSMEKQIGSATPQELILLYSDSMVNTLSLSAPAGALATYSAGLVTAGEARIDRAPGVGFNGLSTPGPIVNTEANGVYPSAYDDLLVFHGGRIMLGDNPSQSAGGDNPAVRDDTWQAVEFSLNNNIAADEYTIRPSRFLRSLTVGIRQLDINFTLVFENPDKYSKFAYGNAANNSPGYAFYMGALQIFLGNYQLLNNGLDGVGSVLPYAGAANAVSFAGATPGVNNYAAPANSAYVGSTPPAPGNGSQFVQLNMPKLAFTGFPVALASGRIAVTTTARALRDPNAPIVSAYVGPTGAGLQY